MTTTLKTVATRALLEAISFTQLASLFTSARGRGIIFTLHHVRPKTQHAFDPNVHLEITPEFLDVAIQTAKSEGLTPAHLEDLPTLLSSGDPSARYVCFTLDDGYRNNAQYAAPIFRKHNVPYTIFICPGFVERTHTIWWETVTAVLREANSISFDFGRGHEKIDTETTRAKQKAFNRFKQVIETRDEDLFVSQIDALAKTMGIDAMSIVNQEVMNERELGSLRADPLCRLGGHTVSHCNLARVSAERMHHEIATSCSKVSAYMNKPVKTFAYPYGWARAAGPREFKMCHDLGLNAGVTTTPHVLQNANALTMAALPRVSLNGHFQEKRLVSALISGLPFKFY